MFLYIFVLLCTQSVLWESALGWTKVWSNDLSLSTHKPVFAQVNTCNTQVSSLDFCQLSQAACKWKIFSQHQQTQCIFILSFYIYTIALLVTQPKWDVWYVKSYFRLRGKRDATNDLLYLLFGCILLSPLFHVTRGFGDALGLHSSDTSFPSVAMTRMGLSTKTGADAV